MLYAGEYHVWRIFYNANTFAVVFCVLHCCCLLYFAFLQDIPKYLSVEQRATGISLKTTVG